jgi:AraC-like DNA-binding protein
MYGANELKNYGYPCALPPLNNGSIRNHASDIGFNPTMDSRIVSALNFIDSTPIHLVSVDTTAAVVCLSSSRFRHLFKEHVGISFHQHLIRVRLSKAHNLIHSTDQPVARIGQLVGSRDVSHFTRDYKRAFGVTPGAHRRRSMRHDWPSYSSEKSHDSNLSASQ